MTTALDFVIHSRRQLIRVIAMALSAGAGASLLLVGALMVATSNVAGLAPYLGIVGLGLAGGLITLALVRRHELWQAVLPLVIAIASGVIASVLLVPEQTLVAVPLLAVPVLLMSLGQRGAYTTGVAIVSVLAGASLAATAPRPMLGADQVIIGDALPLVNGMGAAILIIVIWLVSHRLVSLSDAAVMLADERAAEAQAAQSVAEAARLTIEQRSAEQQRLLELIGVLETPVITIADGVLLAPIVGHLDSQRTERLSRRLLEAVHDQHVTTVILDIAGVPLVDTQVAQAMVRTAQAVQLLGSRVILTGITSAIALTLSHLGVRMDEFQVVRSPQEALELINSD